MSKSAQLTSNPNCTHGDWDWPEGFGTGGKFRVCRKCGHEERLTVVSRGGYVIGSYWNDDEKREYERLHPTWSNT